MGFFDDAQKYMNKKTEGSALSVLEHDPAFFRKLTLRFPNVHGDKIQETLSNTLKTLDSYADEQDLLKELDRILLD